MTRHLQRREHEAIKAERQALLDFESALVAWKDAPRDLRGERPVLPVPMARSIVSDVTIEALAEKLANSPGGLLLYRDELAGWVKSFDRYRGGRGGDAAQWLELHNAGSIFVDRKSGGTINVPRAAVSIIGTVQPGVLAKALTGEHMEDGLAARILYSMPPVVPACWSDDEVSPLVRGDWGTLLDELRTMPVNDEPTALTLTRKARAEWIKWYGEVAARVAQSDTDVESAVGSKIEGVAARLALVRQLVEDPGAPAVGIEAMVAGIEMARWFHDEALRVLRSFTETTADRARRKLVEWIDARGGAVTERALARGPRSYREPGAARVALDDLVSAGLAIWKEAPASDRPQGGGHRVRRCVLRHSDGGDGDGSVFVVGGENGDGSLAGVGMGAETSVASGDGSLDSGNEASPSPVSPDKKEQEVKL